MAQILSPNLRELEIDLCLPGVFEGTAHVNNNVPASSATAVELPKRRSEPPTRWPRGRARSAATVDASLHHWSTGCIGAGCAGRGGQRLAPTRAVLLAHSVQLTTRVRCRGCGGARHEAEAEPGAPTSQKATLAPVQVLGAGGHGAYRRARGAVRPWRLTAAAPHLHGASGVMRRPVCGRHPHQRALVPAPSAGLSRGGAAFGRQAREGGGQISGVLGQIFGVLGRRGARCARRKRSRPCARRHQAAAAAVESGIRAGRRRSRDAPNDGARPFTNIPHSPMGPRTPGAGSDRCGLCEMLRNGCAPASASASAGGDGVHRHRLHPHAHDVRAQPPRSQPHLLPTAEAGAQPLAILPALNRFAPPRPPASKSLPSGIRRAQANVPLLLAFSACSPSPVTLPPTPRAADDVEKQERAPENASRKSSAAARWESTGTRSRGVCRCDERSP